MSSKRDQEYLIVGSIVTLVLTAVCGIGAVALVVDVIAKFNTGIPLEIIAGIVYAVFAVLAIVVTVIFACLTITQACWLGQELKRKKQ